MGSPDLGAALPPLVLVGALVVLSFLTHATGCDASRSGSQGCSESNASTSLKTITSAQADFRANDRDGDGVTQFWRADIAGLYALAPGGSPAIRLIELSVAAADDRPVVGVAQYAVKSPKAGYWFRALRYADETTTVDAFARFAAEAHPASYPSSGRWTFIVNEDNTVYRADLGHGRGLTVFPSDEELRTKWSKLD